MILAKGAGLIVWKPGVWRQLKVAWGNALEVWVDGEKTHSMPWDGLFGPLPAEGAKMRLFIGGRDARHTRNEFTIDELTVLGPRPGNVAWRPRMSVPLLDGAPEMNGTLHDPFWLKAGEATGFVGSARRELVRDQPTFLAAYTADGLYFGARIPMPGGREPKAALTEHNAGFSAEDALEVFLQPRPSSPAFFQFAANAIKTKAEAQFTEKGEPVKSFNPDWKVATGFRYGNFTAEIYIPFKALGLDAPPKAGDVWGGNFISDSPDGPSAARTWAFTEGNSAQPLTFGELLFTGKERALRDDSFTGFSEGSPTIRFDLVGEYPPVIRINAEFLDSQGKSISEKTFRITDSPSAILGVQYLQTGLYTARLSAVDDAGMEYFRQNVLFRIAKAFTLVVKNYPYAGVAEATANMGTLEGKAAEVSFKLLSAKNQELASQSVNHFVRGAATAKLATADLEPGDYAVEASAADAQGKPLGSVRQGLRIFPKPEWWKNNLGINHFVPSPWTPVKATEKGYGVWGRDYQFGDSVFPRQIISRSKPLFNATPRIVLSAGGKEMDLVAAPHQAPKQEYPDQVELTASTEVGGVSAKLKGTLEFDGCYRFDLELDPNGVKSLDGLILELAIPREIGQFFATSTGLVTSVGEIRPAFKRPFVPYLWIGNDDLGLAVFTESDQYWRPRGADAIQITVTQDTTLLKLNVVSAPLALKAPITYTFGLMASPVRPILDGDPFAPGFNCIDPDEIIFPEFLLYPAQGVTTPEEGTLEFRVRRTKARASEPVELFSFVELGENDPHPTVKPSFIECTAGSDIHVDVNQTRLLTANASLSGEEFSHVAFTWDAKSVSLYLNGLRVATAEPTDAFRKILESAVRHDGTLRFGCEGEVEGFTAIELDEIRASSKARYHGESFAPPDGPFQEDADTRLLDPLDDTFIPDGQDGLTASGGQPSLGCQFVAGKFGRALSIEVAPPHPAAELVKACNASVVNYWNWIAGGAAGGASENGWPPMLFGPVAPDFLAAIETAHKRGLKIIQYTGYPAIGAPSPLADQFANEWEVLPVDMLPYPPPPGHYMLNSSLSARGFADYYAAGVDRLLKLGSDGIYNDGLDSDLYPSQNLYAGSGYLDENEIPRPTVPIFAWRESFKRLYRMIKEHDPNGFIVNHCSRQLVLPTMSFSDIYYTGEHENYENLLDARIRFSGRPWGLQAALLGASSHMYSPLHTMIELLLGTGQFGFNLVDRNGLGRKWINLRKAYLAFDYKSAEWAPFFKNRDTFYTAEDAKTPISLYYHPGKDAFLVVGNLDARDRTVNVQLHLKAFGLEGAALRARNALTQVPAELAPDGKLGVLVRAKSFVLVAVERNP
jgi:hypothetical protein